MELYKLRYNLYNYIFDSNIDYNLLVVSKNISKYFLIAIFVIFILIIISDISKISYIVFFFVLFGLILIYLTFIIDTTFDTIKTDKKFVDYCIYFRLFNSIFIDSYKNNDIPIYIKNDEYPDITKKNLTNIIDDSISKVSNNNYYNSSSLSALPTTKIQKLDVYNKVKNSSFLSLSEFSGKLMTSYYKDILFSNDNIEYYNNYLYSDTPIDFTEYLKFKSGVSYLYLNISLTVRILIVGGGGGGAKRTDEFKFGGGGGGGQVKEELNFILPIGFYQITVGNGGDIGENGGISSIKRKSDSKLEVFDIDVITAGGGGGGISSVSGTQIESGTGGGGGGNSFKDDTITLGGKAKVVGEDTSKKSADGGNGNNVKDIGYLAGGGGGGIQSKDYNPLNNIQGNGGIGIDSDITGTQIGYGGGGGGGRDFKTSSAGHGGGNGGGYSQTGEKYTSIDAIPGTPNTGGGGGGYCHKIAGQLSGKGGSGVVIIRFLNQSTNSKNNIYTPKENGASDINNSIIIANTNENLEEINIIKYSIATTPPSYQYNIYLEYSKNRDETPNPNQELNKLYNKIYEYLNEYYNTYNDIIELLEISSLIKVDYKYLYSINLNNLELKKDKSGILKNLYDLFKEYFIKKLATSPVLYTTKDGTDKFQNILINQSDNNYLNTFYNTLMEINTNIKYNDNVGKDNIYIYSEDLIKSNSLLKFIDINNDNKYRLLKKWIFIKIDEDNDFHKEIKNDYNNNKDKYIYDVNNQENITVSEVVKNITSIYSSTETLKYFLIDIETINKFAREKNQENNNYNLSINSYVLNIYKTLLNNYNYRIDLNNTLQNFDILFDVNKDIDKEVNILINNYLYYYNLIIVIVIIIMTIILHIFYIELFRLI